MRVRMRQGPPLTRNSVCDTLWMPIAEARGMVPLLWLQATRTVTIGLVAAASRLSLMTLNDFSVRQDKRHARLVDLVLDRPDGVPLITVRRRRSHAGVRPR